MNNTHLNTFRSTDYISNLYVGLNANAWSQQVLGNQYVVPIKLDRKMSRTELFAFCQASDNNNFDTILAILSWGGMNRKHGRVLLKNTNGLEGLVENLRAHKFKDREEAFFEFQKCRQEKLLPGLGIGYFTKLICFLQPVLKGYIMDQWVAKSVNLLYSDQIVNITNNWVSDENNCKSYEHFCSCIDELSEDSNLSGLETEEKLFSIGGKKKGIWRTHVIENYR